MTIAKIIMASVAAISIISSGALAQGEQARGQILKIDEANGKITLQHKLTGTVGAASANTAVYTYKIQDGVTVNGLQAGDQVVWTEAQKGDVWTVTKIQKQ
jgi:Cu/Ag efflux protein CusF